MQSNKEYEGEVRMKAGSLRFAAAAVLMLAAAIVLQAHSRREYFPPRTALSSLPLQIDGWTGTDSVLDQQTLDVLGPGDFLVRDYENASQSQLWVDLYIAYFPSQKPAIRSIRRTTACQVRDGSQLRVRWFGLLARTALRSPSIAIWFQNRETGS